MIDDLQANDIAAGKIYFGMQSHFRFTKCIDEASKATEPILQSIGITSFSERPTPFMEGDCVFYREWGWNKTHEVGWGFWFTGPDLASWRNKYDPVWSVAQGVMVYVQQYGSKLVRPKVSQFGKWTFPISEEVNDDCASIIKPVEEFLDGPDSTKKIVKWIEGSVLEAVELLKVLSRN